MSAVNLWEIEDALYEQGSGKNRAFKVKINDLTFSLSGMENKVKQMAEKGESKEDIARFALDTVCATVVNTTKLAQERWPGLPVLCSGGVASNTQLRRAMTQACGALFAEPKYSTDNAMGTAILTWRAMQEEQK